MSETFGDGRNDHSKQERIYLCHRMYLSEIDYSRIEIKDDNSQRKCQVFQSLTDTRKKKFLTL